MTLPVSTLVGPISGVADGNEAAFTVATDTLISDGWRVFNPLKNDLSKEALMEAKALGDDYRRGKLYHELMKQCLRNITNSDAIHVLPNWENSNGARLEVYTALNLGTPVWLFGDDCVDVVKQVYVVVPPSLPEPGKFSVSHYGPAASHVG